LRRKKNPTQADSNHTRPTTVFLSVSSRITLDDRAESEVRSSSDNDAHIENMNNKARAPTDMMKTSTPTVRNVINGGPGGNNNRHTILTDNLCQAEIPDGDAASDSITDNEGGF
jgi:hypothetical protein